MKIYQRIASTLTARQISGEKLKIEWFDKHTETIENIVKKHFPSGSGFDNGTAFNFEKSTPNRLVFDTGFHHMRDGYYTAWTTHQIIITPDLATDFDMRVTGKNLHGIKDYIAECFTGALDREVL